MKLFLKYISLLVILAISNCSVVVPFKQADHEGYDLKVWIDGKRTHPMDMPVFQGLNYFQHISGPGLWKIDSPVSGQPVFEYTFDSAKLGQFVEAKATFEKLREHEAGLFEPFYSNLSGYTSEFSPGYAIKADNFQTAESDEVISRLPAGNYLVRIFVSGSKGWDSQAIFVHIQ